MGSKAEHGSSNRKQGCRLWRTRLPSRNRSAAECPQSSVCGSRSTRYRVVTLFPHPKKFSPFLLADLPLSLITDECQLLLLLTHPDPRSGRLPPFTERCDGMVAIDQIDADAFDVADDHPSIPRIIVCSGGTNIGTRNTPRC